MLCEAVECRHDTVRDRAPWRGGGRVGRTDGVKVLSVDEEEVHMARGDYVEKIARSAEHACRARPRRSLRVISEALEI